MALIVVESPTKARTFNRILKATSDEKAKNKYFVFATMGHFRDLPHNKMAINFKQNFKPEFEIMTNKTKVVEQLKKLAEENDEIILATDPDREGESIAYHVAYLLGYVNENWPNINLGTKELKRIVFHEITPRALQEALEHPEALRMHLVKAQLARRILDRVVGYELSPLLWRKMGKNWLSAGRVQTVALRIIVEREKEIRLFKTEEYYQIYGNFKSQIPNSKLQINSKDQNFNLQNNDLIKAKLVSKDNVIYEQKTKLQLFASEYTYTKTSIDEKQAQNIQTGLQSDNFKINDIKETILTRYPPPPFTTSLLQQEAFHRFGFSSKMTMKLAQDLYEQGLITYHRTDSFNLSSQFVFGAKKYITETYGEFYALDKPRGFRTKSKMAQEAHEAIRPTRFNPSPEKKATKNKKKTKVTASFAQNHERLYTLIFNRAIATQMKEALIKVFTVTITSTKGYEFQSEKQQIAFEGFLKILNPEFVKSHSLGLNLTAGKEIKLVNIDLEKLNTKPPARYNEATLIKEMEERGVGRPSTYAPIISLIQEKNYVEKDFRYFNPTKLGEAISEYLSKAFPDIFDLDFTASMEDNLDMVAENTKDFIKLLQDFNTPFFKKLELQKSDTTVIDVEEEVDDKCAKCNSQMIVRFSRYGKFLACSKYPTCKFTKPFLKPIANKICPKCQGSIISILTKSKKRFYGCSNYPKCDFSSWTLGSISNIKVQNSNLQIKT